MSPEDIDRLTIAEVRDIVERAASALKQMREVQALLGGMPAESSPLPMPVAHGQVITNKGPAILSAAERAKKLSLPAFQSNGEPYMGDEQ